VLRASCWIFREVTARVVGDGVAATDLVARAGTGVLVVFGARVGVVTGPGFALPRPVSVLTSLYALFTAADEPAINAAVAAAGRPAGEDVMKASAAGTAMAFARVFAETTNSCGRLGG
jgi:hypothetical protein